MATTGPSTSFITDAFTYDAKGNLLTIRSAYDIGADGTIDAVFAATFTYDAKGNLLTMRFASE